MKQTNSLIKNLDGEKKDNFLPLSKFITLLILVIISGLITGFIINKIKNKSMKSTLSQKVSNENKIGITDKKTFKDKAEGILREGGIDGEGNFHLERPGGPSQNVYLTSSTVDLSKFIGKKIRVWGETFAAEKAGWLMDVGLVEIIK